MPTTDLAQLYDLAEQLLGTDDATDRTLETLERVADRIDVLRAAGTAPPGVPPISSPPAPVHTRVAATRPAQSAPRARTATAPTITVGPDRRPLHGGEAALEATLATALDDALRAPTPARQVLVTLLAAGGVETLGRDAFANLELVASARAALVASGGSCSPTPYRYEQRALASQRRPVRDALLSFQATRGGIRYRLPPSFADNDAAAGVVEWTYDNDVTPSNPATKPYASMSCDEVEQDVKLSAITQSLRLGTWSIRWDFERVAAWLQTLAAEHAALGEERLLAEIVAGSKLVSLGQTLGTARDVVAGLDRVASMFRNRHRLEPSATLTFIVPSYLRDMMRADLAREAPGASTERLAVTDAELTKMFSVRNIAPAWSLDYQRVDDVQGVGAALGWPSLVEGLLFAQGSWLYLDGGTLDLGVFRDLAMTQTNDALFFAESFERAAFIGGPNESLRLSFDVCSNGGYASPLDIAPCVSGS